MRENNVKYQPKPFPRGRDKAENKAEPDFKPAGAPPKVGRISTALSRNMAKQKQLSFDFVNEDFGVERNSIIVSDKEVKMVNDTTGKLTAFNTDERLLIEILSSYIDFYNSEVQERIKALEVMGEDSGQSYNNLPPLTKKISIPELSKIIKGNTKIGSLKAIEATLKSLSQKVQAQNFFVKKGEETLSFTKVRPYIELVRDGAIYANFSEIRDTRGKKTDSKKGDERVLVYIKVKYCALFLQELNKNYCPVYTDKVVRMFKDNKNEILAHIYDELKAKWKQYYTASKKEETLAKKENKELLKYSQKEYHKTIKEARNSGATLKLTFTSIKDGLYKDYESRQRKRKFIPDLRRAIKDLIEYGIITKETQIDENRGLVYFVYNPEFSQKEREVLALQDGEN